MTTMTMPCTAAWTPKLMAFNDRSVNSSSIYGLLSFVWIDKITSRWIQSAGISHRRNDPLSRVDIPDPINRMFSPAPPIVPFPLLPSPLNAAAHTITLLPFIFFINFNAPQLMRWKIQHVFLCSRFFVSQSGGLFRKAISARLMTTIQLRNTNIDVHDR